jgi:hypothetical protein
MASPPNEDQQFQLFLASERLLIPARPKSAFADFGLAQAEVLA